MSILSASLTGNLTALNLVGDVEVRDLAVNQVAFDPVLAGTVNASSGKSVDLRLSQRQRQNRNRFKSIFPADIFLSQTRGICG